MNGEQSSTPGSASNQSINGGWIVMWIGAAIVFAPMIISAIGTSLFCGANANEGNCGFAALPWLMFLSVPFGGILFIVGWIIGITESNKQSRAAQSEPGPTVE